MIVLSTHEILHSHRIASLGDLQRFAKRLTVTHGHGYHVCGGYCRIVPYWDNPAVSVIATA